MPEDAIAAQIEVERTYNITIQGRRFTDLRLILEWNGLTKFGGPSGSVIVMSNPTAPAFESFLSSLLSSGNELASAVVIKTDLPL